VVKIAEIQGLFHRELDPMLPAMWTQVDPFLHRTHEVEIVPPAGQLGLWRAVIFGFFSNFA